MDDVAQQRSLLSLISMPITAGAADMSELVITSFIAIAGSMVLIATVDVPFQLWEHHRKLKMTKEEVRQENKETEAIPSQGSYPGAAAGNGKKTHDGRNSKGRHNYHQSDALLGCAQI